MDITVEDFHIHKNEHELEENVDDFLISKEKPINLKKI